MSDTHAARFAEAAGMLLDDALRMMDPDAQPGDSGLSLLIGSMIERRATEAEYVDLLYAVASVATMAVKTELAHSIEEEREAGPVVSFLVRAREGLRE